MEAVADSAAGLQVEKVNQMDLSAGDCAKCVRPDASLGTRLQITKPLTGKRNRAVSLDGR